MAVSENSLCLVSALTAALVMMGADQARAQSPNEIFTYQEACDGSAAVAVGADHFVVADDDLNVLRIYQHKKAKPVWSLPLDKFLEAPPKKKPPEFKEADIEGAARIGNRIYWIGSHGRDSEGGAEPGRARFFATSITTHESGPRLETVGSGAYKNLRDALFADPSLAKLKEAYLPDEKNGPAPESNNGFNIEGLSATPDGRLLLGFRNPRPNDKAVVIPINNPADVVEKGSAPILGASMLLDLKGRGIRSMDWIGNRYLIVAGPHGKAEDSKIEPRFALFTWGGPESDKLDMVKLETPEKFTPEAAFVNQDGATITLLSDDGDLGGCKKAPEAGKKFRSLTLPVPK